MSRQFVDTIVFRPPSQRNAGATSKSELKRMKKEESEKVKRRVQKIIRQLKKQGRLKWQDPHFGPQDEDDNAASSLYRSGKTPRSVGNSKYPDPDDVIWNRPIYMSKNGNAGTNPSSKDGSSDESSDGMGMSDGEYDDEYDDLEPAYSSNESWCKKAQLFVDGAHAGDVKQGQLGDCWFLGALATLAVREDKVRDLFWPSNEKKLLSIQKYGIFVCKFMKDFVWYYVIIDDRIPVYANSGKPIFAKCGEPDELWVLLVEKAYAKLHQAYDALIGGFIDYGLRDMTGLVSEQIVLRQGHLGFHQETKKQIDSHIFWNRLCWDWRNGSMMGASIQPDPKKGGHSKVEANAGHGLHQRHAYSILAVAEVPANTLIVKKTSGSEKGEEKNKEPIKMVILRNPWGQGEWTGEWSDMDDRRRDEKNKKALIDAFRNAEIRGLVESGCERDPDCEEDWVKVIRWQAKGKNGDTIMKEKKKNVQSIKWDSVLDVNGNDGTFVMKYEDFLSNYTHMFRCIDFPDSWTGSRVAGAWTQDTAGGHYGLSTWHLNPRYLLKVYEDCEFFMSVSGSDPRLEFGKEYNLHAHPFGFHICTMKQTSDGSDPVPINPRHCHLKNSPKSLTIPGSVEIFDENNQPVFNKGSFTSQQQEKSHNYCEKYDITDQPPYKFHHATSCWVTLKGPSATKGGNSDYLNRWYDDKRKKPKRIMSPQEEEQREKEQRPYALYAIVPSMHKRKWVGKFFLSVYGEGPDEKEASPLPKFELPTGSVIAEEAEVPLPTESDRTFDTNLSDTKTDGVQQISDERFTDSASVVSHAGDESVPLGETARAIQYEEVREKVVAIAKKREIDVRTLMRMFEPRVEVGGEESKLTRRQFKDSLLELGFHISDITTEGPNNDFNVLAGEDSLLSASEFKAIFEMEQESTDLYFAHLEPKPDDDLNFAPAPSELHGNLHINIVEARDLRLPPGWFNTSSAAATKRGQLLDTQVKQQDVETLLPYDLADYLYRGNTYGESKEPSFDGLQIVYDLEKLFDDTLSTEDSVNNTATSSRKGSVTGRKQNDDANVSPVTAKEISASTHQDDAGLGPIVKESIKKYADGKHDSKKIRKLEVRRAEKLKKMRLRRQRELENQARDRGKGTLIQPFGQDTEYDSFIDVICIDENGASKTVGAKEYRSRTQHRANETKNANGWRHNHRKRVRASIDLGKNERKSLTNDLRNFVEEHLLSRIFTIINILEDYSPTMGPTELTSSTKRAMSTSASVGVDSAVKMDEDDSQEMSLSLPKDLHKFLPAYFAKQLQSNSSNNSQYAGSQSNWPNTTFHEYNNIFQEWRWHMFDNRRVHCYADQYMFISGNVHQVKDVFLHRYLGKPMEDEASFEKMKAAREKEHLEIVNNSNVDIPQTTPLLFRKSSIPAKNIVEVISGSIAQQKKLDITKEDNSSADNPEENTQKTSDKVEGHTEVADELRNDQTNTNNHKISTGHRIISPRQARLFSIDEGDTIIWQRCMRLQGIETTLSRNEMESQHLKSWFTKFDTDNSFTLDENEFGFALSQMGFKLSKKEVRTLMERFDKEGDGEIDYREFAGWVSAESDSDKGLGLGFRPISVLIKKVHKILENDILPDVQKHRAKLARASPTGKAASGSSGDNDGGNITDTEEGDGGLYWPMGGDPVSLSQFREMIAERTPLQLLSEKSKLERDVQKNAQIESKSEAQEEASEDTEFGNGISEKVDDNANDENDSKMSSEEADDSEQYVWREQFTTSELRRICSVFNSTLGKVSGGAAAASEAFANFGRMTPEEVDQMCELQDVESRMRRGLLAMATTPGKLEEVNVRKAYFQFMSMLSLNEKVLSVDKFVSLLRDILPVDWGNTDETGGTLEGKSDGEKENESESGDAAASIVEEKVSAKSQGFGQLMSQKLRMVLDINHIWGVVSCADIAKLMKGDIVRELENKLRYMLTRKALAVDGMCHWLVDIALSADRKKVKVYARDPESTKVMKLVLDENTCNIRALGDYLLTPEEIRLRGLDNVRHQKKKKPKSGKQAQEMEQTIQALEVESERMVRALEKRCSDDRLVPVFVEDLFHEGRSCEALANRILISTDHKTGDKLLKLGEEQSFVVALRDAFAESEFDFFVNVTQEYLTFKVEKEPSEHGLDTSSYDDELKAGENSHGLVSLSSESAPTQTRMRKRLVLKAIRSKPKLCAFLGGVSSVLGVVFESSSGHSSEEITWTDFLGHLASKRNPYFTLELLPSHQTTDYTQGRVRFQRTPPCEDGGSAPWFDDKFRVEYTPTKKKLGKIVHTDVVRMGFHVNAKGNSQADVAIERKEREEREARKRRKIAGRALTSIEKDLSLPKLKDPRYVVVTVRRDEEGVLKATAYDSRSANEYEVVGAPYWWSRKSRGDAADPFVHLSFGGYVDPMQKPYKKENTILHALRSDLKYAEIQYEAVDEAVHAEEGDLGHRNNKLKIESVGKENLDDVDYVDPKVWRMLKRHFALGEQITPRLKVTAFTSPLKGPERERNGVDEYIGEVEIPVSTITGLAGLVADKWITMFDHSNEKVGEVRLKCAFDEAGEIRKSALSKLNNMKVNMMKKLRSVLITAPQQSKVLMNDQVEKEFVSKTNSTQKERGDASKVQEMNKREISELRKQAEELKLAAEKEKRVKEDKERELEKEKSKIAELEKRLRQATAAVPASSSKGRPTSQLQQDSGVDNNLSELNMKLAEEEKLRRKAEEAAKVERKRFEAELEAARAASQKETEKAKAIAEEAKKQKEEAEAIAAKARKQKEEAETMAAEAGRQKEEAQAVAEEAKRQQSLAATQEHPQNIVSGDSEEIKEIKTQNEELQRRLKLAEDEARKARDSAARSLALTTAKENRNPSQKSVSKVSSLTWKRMRKEKNAADMKLKGRRNFEETLAHIQDIAASIKGQLVARNPSAPDRPVARFRKLLEASTEDDGRLDSDEFRESLKDMNILLPVDDIRAAVEYLDIQHDGRLVIDELFDIMDKLSKTLGRRGPRRSPIVKNAWADVGDDDGLGPLPPNWEKGITADGKVYFIDHASEATTWDDPRLRSSAAGTGVSAVRSRRGRRN